MTFKKEATEICVREALTIQRGQEKTAQIYGFIMFNNGRSWLTIADLTCDSEPTTGLSDQCEKAKKP